MKQITDSVFTGEYLSPELSVLIFSTEGMVLAMSDDQDGFDLHISDWEKGDDFSGDAD